MRQKKEKNVQNIGSYLNYSYSDPMGSQQEYKDLRVIERKQR